jgi:hypothetical protein
MPEKNVWSVILLHHLYPIKSKSKRYVILDRSTLYYLLTDLFCGFTEKDQEIAEQQFKA